jgi:hypothetical protein
MSNGLNDKGLEEETLAKLENASKEEARNIILDLINPECKSVASSFFTCIEEQTNGFDIQAGGSFEKMENDLNEKFIPNCMSKHNLEECLNTHNPK